MKFNIGDTIKIVKAGDSNSSKKYLGQMAKVIEIGKYVDFILSDLPDCKGFWPDEIELVSHDNVTTVAKQEVVETNLIVSLIEEYTRYEAKPFKLRKPRSKSGETIAVLIQILVSKDLISSQDVSRILNMKK
jgi:hypothetical protein